MAESKKTNHNWIIWTALFLAFCLSFYTLRSVLLPFVTGLILGYLFDPFAAKLEKTGLNRGLAAILVLVLVVIILIPGIILLTGMINEQLIRFINFIPEYISSLIKKSEPVLLELQEQFPNLEPEKIKEYLSNNAANGLKIVGSVTQKVISGGFRFINLLSLLLITPIVAFYMLRDWPHFVVKVDSLLPRDSKTSIRKIFKEIDKTIAGFIRGQLSVCVILGTFYGVGLHLIGVQLGIVIGFIAGIISFIPYVGSITGFIISIIIALVQFDSYIPAIQVVAVFAVGQFIEGNFLTPKLVGDSVGLHPVWVMFALLSGGVLLGFLGLLIAVPTAAIIGVLIRHSIENYKKSGLYTGK